MSDTPTKTECECGCGGATKGGRFLPGHDAKLKKALIQAALTGSKRAETKLEKLGWTKFLDAKRNKLAAAKKAGGKPVPARTPRPSPRRRSTEPEEGAQAEASPARKRGRPRKNPPEAADATSTDATAPE